MSIQIIIAFIAAVLSSIAIVNPKPTPPIIGEGEE